MLKIYSPLLAGLLLASPAFAAETTFDNSPALRFALPRAEADVPTVAATPVFVAGKNRQTLEGAIFDDKGNLLFCDVTDRKVLRLSPSGSAETVVELADMAPCGLAFHKDGRLFICAIDQTNDRGAIFALAPGAAEPETIIGEKAGYWPNDMVFAPDGGFYFTDFRGSATNPAGGVYHVSPDFKTITPIIPKLAQANGVALSPDGKTLWATEYARNLLHRVNLADAVPVPRTGSKIPYHFIGAAPDSMRVDSEGNVYVAMVGQGRVLIFNENGVPIGQVVLPERDRGNNLRSTSVAIHPVNNELRIVSGNTQEAEKGDAMVFRAPAFAKGISIKDR